MTRIVNRIFDKRVTALVLTVLTSLTFAGWSDSVAASQVQGNVSEAQLQPLREAMSKYKDPIAAVHDGYWSTLGCVMFPDGVMGIHFVNGMLIGPKPDPMKPQALIYVPKDNGLELAAVEWFVPLATGVKEAPVLFGQKFDGPMPGHEPLQPKALEHYDMHLWLFDDNPNGIFAETNPNVSCDGADFPVEIQETATH